MANSTTGYAATLADLRRGRDRGVSSDRFNVLAVVLSILLLLIAFNSPPNNHVSASEDAKLWSTFGP